MSLSVSGVSGTPDNHYEDHDEKNMINIMMRMVIRVMPKKNNEYHQMKINMRIMMKIMTMNIMIRMIIKEDDDVDDDDNNYEDDDDDNNNNNNNNGDNDYDDTHWAVGQ